MTRAEKINIALDKHFKSNNGNWFVKEDAESNNYVTLCFHAFSETKIKSTWVALYILKNFKSVEYVYYYGWVFTRNSLRRAGYNI